MQYSQELLEYILSVKPLGYIKYRIYSIYTIYIIYIKYIILKR